MKIAFILVYKLLYLKSIHHWHSGPDQGPALQALLTNLADA